MAVTSAADRLASAKSSFETAFQSSHSNRLMSRDTPLSSAAGRLAAAKSSLEASFGTSLSGLNSRSETAAARLAAAKSQLEATFSHVSRRGVASAADRLAAAKHDLEDHWNSAHSLAKRAELSAVDRLTAAKNEIEYLALTSKHPSLTKRDGDAQVTGEAEMPVSNFQKTVMPIIIGLVLLFIFAIVAGFIVYKRRQRNKATESEQHRRKHLDLEDDGADEDFGYELPRNQQMQHVHGYKSPEAGATFQNAQSKHSATSVNHKEGEQSQKEFV